MPHIYWRNYLTSSHKNYTQVSASEWSITWLMLNFLYKLLYDIFFSKLKWQCTYAFSFHTRSINYELICTTEIRWYRAPSTSCNNVALYSLALYIQKREGEKTTEKNRRACADRGRGGGVTNMPRTRWL